MVMTTEEMKFALLWHFRYRLQYPMVATECFMATEGSSGAVSSIADILAIKKAIMVEIEIKRYRWEMGKDLENKARKHAFYLHTKGLWDNWYDSWEKSTIRPNKFYFAYHLSPKNRKNHDATCYPFIPAPYGLIIVYQMYDCKVLKQAKWLHRDLTHLEAAKERMCLRLVAENIALRLNKYDRKNGRNYGNERTCQGN